MEASPEDVQCLFQQGSLHDIQTNADTESSPDAPDADCHTSGLCQACPGVGSIPSQTPTILTTSRFSGSVIMAIIYGYNAVPENDPFVSKAMRQAELVVNVITIERAILLSAFPICEFARIITLLDEPINCDFSVTYPFMVAWGALQAVGGRMPFIGEEQYG